MVKTARTHASGGQLVRSMVWNFTGLLAPLLVGLISIPLLIDGMGKERFGLLAIIWMGVGYFSLFDMGMGRALTKLVSERLGSGKQGDMGSLLWSALFLILAFGSLGAALLLWGAGPLIREIFNVPASLEDEAVLAFRVLSLGLPLVVVTAALVGILEAHQRFGRIMAVRVPMGVLTFLLPLITLQFSPSLVWATCAILGARVLASGVYFWMAAGSRPELLRPERPVGWLIKALFSFGGWLTVTNVIGPLMVYFDRFLIGALLSMTAVTFYVTPYEVLSRVQLVSVAVMGVLFPAMAAAIVSDRERLGRLFHTGVSALFILMLPITALFFFFAPEGLGVWLGPEFMEQSTVVVKWLALGWLINVLAQGPFTLLQSGGRPDLVAKAHLVELLPYSALLWLMTDHFGIAGTAAAWALRVMFDTMLLTLLAALQFPDLKSTFRRIFLLFIATLFSAAMAWWLESIILRAFGLFVAIAITVVPAIRLARDYFAVERNRANTW